MIETADALADVEAILALDTVDGVFVGPSDLSLSRGRGRYRFDEADRSDLARIVQACGATGKEVVYPAWTKAERDHATALGIGSLVVVEQQGAMADGLRRAIASFT